MGAPTIPKFDLEGDPCSAVLPLRRHYYFHSEFNCLLKCAANENVTGDAGWKPE